MKNKYIILLTGCINPKGMPFTKINKIEERLHQYVKSIDYYINVTCYPIIFTENSNTDITPFLLMSYSRDRLEILTFDGNKNKSCGKGLGEAEIIEYALKKSKFINKDSIIIKITGRLIVKNLPHLLKFRKHFPKNTIQTIVHSDLSFFDSRIIVAPYLLYQMIVNNKDKMNDFFNVYFEHILAQVIKQQKKFCFIPFIEEPVIDGMSASTGQIYSISNNSNFSYLHYQLYLIRKINDDNGAKYSALFILKVDLLYALLSFILKIQR